MLIKNRKGLSLTELMIALVLIGIVSPLIFTIFVFGLEDYSTTTKYVNQQYSVMEVTRYIRQDVEAAKKVIYVCKDEGGNLKIEEVIFMFPDKSLRIWEFGTSGKAGDSFKGLRLKSVPSGKYDFDEEGKYVIDETIEYENIIGNLDLSQSGFALDTFDINKGISRLMLTIRPEKLNTTKYRGRNINENIITEFSVRNKINEIYVKGD